MSKRSLLTSIVNRAYSVPGLRQALLLAERLRQKLMPHALRAQYIWQTKAVPFINTKALPFLRRTNRKLVRYRLLSQFAFPWIAGATFFIYGYARHSLPAAAMLGISAYLVTSLIMAFIPYAALFVCLILLGSLARGFTIFSLKKGPPQIVCQACNTAWEIDAIAANDRSFARDEKGAIIGCPANGCTYWAAKEREQSQAQRRQFVVDLVNPGAKTLTDAEFNRAVGEWRERAQKSINLARDRFEKIRDIARESVSDNSSMPWLFATFADYIEQQALQTFYVEKTPVTAELLLYSFALAETLRGDQPELPSITDKKFMSIYARNILTISREQDIITLYEMCEAADDIIGYQDTILRLLDRIGKLPEDPPETSDSTAHLTPGQFLNEKYGPKTQEMMMRAIVPLFEYLKERGNSPPQQSPDSTALPANSPAM